MTAPAGEAQVRHAARVALDKRALDLVVLDVQGVSGIADYFLVCSGGSTTHIQTIADAIRDELRSQGVRPRHTEGVPESGARARREHLPRDHHVTGGIAHAETPEVEDRA